MNIFYLIPLLIGAALIGDNSNYWIGRFFGEKLVANPRIPINEKHIEQTEAFFKKHGGKTIILARFVPIVRTFTPFVAGAGQMNYIRFLSFSVLGAVSWVSIGTLAGYFFGNIPFVRENFSLVIIGVVLISVLPLGFEFLKSRLSSTSK